MSAILTYSQLAALGRHPGPTEYDAMVTALNGTTVTGVRSYPFDFFIRENGGNFEAIDSAHNIVYGGPDDAGSIDGADWSAVMQACVDALTAGGLIVLGSGTIPNTAAATQIDLDNNIRIVGAGMQATVIQPAEGITIFKSTGVVGTPKYGIQLENFTIEGDSVGVNQIGIEFAYTYSNTAISNVQMKNMGGIGIKLSNCYAIRVCVEVASCNDYGFLAYDCHGSYFYVKAYDCGVTSSNPNIGCYYCTRARLECVSEGTHGTLLHIDKNGSNRPEGMVVSGYFEGSKRITVKEAYGTIIDGCRFVGTGAADYAIVTDGTCEYTHIINTSFSGSYSTACILQAAASVLYTSIENIALLTTGVPLISDAGGGTSYRNVGTLKLENYGSTTLNEGESSKVVAHGLSNTPYYVFLTSTSQGIDDVTYHSEDGTNFTIATETAVPGGFTAVVVWHAYTYIPAGWPT